MKINNLANLAIIDSTKLLVVGDMDSENQIHVTLL